MPFLNLAFLLTGQPPEYLPQVLTHWLSPGFNTHTAQLGLLRISVPEPGALLLLAAGGGVLGLLYWVSRRV